MVCIGRDYGSALDYKGENESGCVLYVAKYWEKDKFQKSVAYGGTVHVQFEAGKVSRGVAPLLI